MKVAGQLNPKAFACQPLLDPMFVGHLRHLGIEWNVVSAPDWPDTDGADVCIFTTEQVRESRAPMPGFNRPPTRADVWIDLSIETKIAFDETDIELVTNERRELIHSGRVDRIWKSNTYSTPELQNGDFIESSLHAAEILGKSHGPMFPILEEDHLAKIHHLPTEIYHQYFDRLFGSNHWPRIEDRPIDVMFVGSMGSPPYPSAVKLHRDKCFAAIAGLDPSWTRLIGGRRSFENWWSYLPALTSSKIVVSPWGHGVSCHRDLEAVAAGCVLIKPELPDHSIIWRDIAVASDFSNLEDVMNVEVMDQIEDLGDVVDEYRSEVHRQRSMGHLAQRIADLLQEATS